MAISRTRGVSLVRNLIAAPSSCSARPTAGAYSMTLNGPASPPAPVASRTARGPWPRGPLRISRYRPTCSGVIVSDDRAARRIGPPTWPGTGTSGGSWPTRRPRTWSSRSNCPQSLIMHHGPFGSSDCHRVRPADALLGGGLAATGGGVDGDGDEQDPGGPQVLLRGAQAEQFQAVVDHGHDDAAEDRAHHLAPAAEQADPADDRGGHREQDVLAALDTGGDRAEVGGVDNATDAGGQPGQGEGEDPDPVQVDAGPAGRLGVAADGVDVPAEPGPAEQEAVDHEHRQDHQDDPGHAAHDQEEPAAVDVADEHHGHPGDRHRGHLQPG